MSSFKMLRAMVGIGVLCALIIVLTFEGTLPRIERLKAEALDKAIFEVLPGMTSKDVYLLDQNNTFVPVEGEVVEGQLIFAGYDEAGKLVGLAVEASGMGFADVLRILYGYDPERQQIIGFYVLESKETPGLGDKIEKDDDFLANFQALDVSLNADRTAVANVVVPVKHGDKENPWEIDGITGATISSRAIGDIIGQSSARLVPMIDKNRELFTVKAEEQAAQ